jgi:hypothetical protein
MLSLRITACSKLLWWLRGLVTAGTKPVVGHFAPKCSPAPDASLREQRADVESQAVAGAATRTPNPRLNLRDRGHGAMRAPAPRRGRKPAWLLAFVVVCCHVSPLANKLDKLGVTGSSPVPPTPQKALPTGGFFDADPHRFPLGDRPVATKWQRWSGSLRLRLRIQAGPINPYRQRDLA